MRATVGQLPAAASPETLEEGWRRLADHVREAGSELVLLPEMPFHRWLPASPEPDPGEWQAAVAAHDEWMERLGELDAGLVAGSRPVLEGRRRFNEGFVWEPARGYRPAQRKRHLPDEFGFWEASWYDPGSDRPFRPLEVAGGLRVGFLICTDLWFGRHARELGRAGAHLVLCPRATPAETREKWIVGGRAAAIASGAWCLSSNHAGPLPPAGRDAAAGSAGPASSDAPALEFAGEGWIIEPEAGEVRAVTDAEHPFLTLELDPGEAEAAKETYPRYVE